LTTASETVTTNNGQHNVLLAEQQAQKIGGEALATAVQQFYQNTFTLQKVRPRVGQG